LPRVVPKERGLVGRLSSGGKGSGRFGQMILPTLKHGLKKKELRSAAPIKRRCSAVQQRAPFRREIKIAEVHAKGQRGAGMCRG